MSDGPPGDVRAYVRSIADKVDAAELPPHWPTCLGCGPDNDSGFHLQVRREGDALIAEHAARSRLLLSEAAGRGWWVAPRAARRP